MKEKRDGAFPLSNSQREWLMISEAMHNIAVVPQAGTPRQRLQQLCFLAAHSETLKTLAIGAVLLNTFLMALHLANTTCTAPCSTIPTTVSPARSRSRPASRSLGSGGTNESWSVFDFGVVIG
jgi:hypothetical protein